MLVGDEVSDITPTTLGTMTIVILVLTVVKEREGAKFCALFVSSHYPVDRKTDC